MGIRFANIIELEGEQVLFYVEPDHDHEEDDRFVLHQIVSVCGVVADVKLGGLTEENADKALANTDEKMASHVLKTIRDLMEGIPGAAA